MLSRMSRQTSKMRMQTTPNMGEPLTPDHQLHSLSKIFIQHEASSIDGRLMLGVQGTQQNLKFGYCKNQSKFRCGVKSYHEHDVPICNTAAPDNDRSLSAISLETDSLGNPTSSTTPPCKTCHNVLSAALSSNAPQRNPRVPRVYQRFSKQWKSCDHWRPCELDCPNVAGIFSVVTCSHRRMGR